MTHPLRMTRSSLVGVSTTFWLQPFIEMRARARDEAKKLRSGRKFIGTKLWGCAAMAASSRNYSKAAFARKEKFAVKLRRPRHSLCRLPPREGFRIPQRQMPAEEFAES